MQQKHPLLTEISHVHDRSVPTDTNFAMSNGTCKYFRQLVLGITLVRPAFSSLWKRSPPERIEQIQDGE